MFRKAYNSMKNLPLIHDLISSEDVTFTYEEQENTEIPISVQDNLKLYKIPRYLEKVRN